MVTAVVRPVRPVAGQHNVARPLPPPPINRRASDFSRSPLDDLGRQLEQWVGELPVRSTEAGD